MSTKSSSGSSSATDLTSSCMARTRLKPCHKTISTTTVNVPIRSAQSRINCGGDGGCYQPRADARSSGLQTDHSEDKVLRIVGNDASNSDMNSTDTSDSTLKAGDSSSCPCESKTRSSCVSLDTLGFYDDDWNGNYEVLYDWIDRMDFVKNQKNVHRDFSDGVLMAELLKKLWPKMVDLHNYSPANSFTNKLANWTTLNSKVLKKMKLGQSQKTLEDLARAEPDVLEQLLGKIKQKYDNSKLKLIPPPSINSEDLSTNVLVLNGEKINKDQFTSLSTKCQQLQNDLTECDEVIKILKNKVSHLEDLLEIKDEIIRNLRQELSQFKVPSGPDTTAPDICLPCRTPDTSNICRSSGHDLRTPATTMTILTAESFNNLC